VQLDAPGIALFARTGTGVAHCPCSNMRLGSGIAPVFCGAADVGMAVINGRVVVREGRLTTLALGLHVEAHNRLAQRLLAPT
jgi:hypothetical protein